MKGLISICRQSSNMREDVITLSIEDATSGISIIRCEMTPSDFARCITGQSSMPCEIERLVSKQNFCNIGKEREIRKVALEGRYSRHTEGEGAELANRIRELLVDDWMLWDDGLRTQQNDHGKHNIVLYRYVDAV